MLLTAFLIGAACAAQRPATASDTTTIVIAATTDVHGRATDWDYERDRPAPLGLVRAATVIDSLRRAYPGRVIVVDAGDLLQGNSLAWVAAQDAGRAINPMVAALTAMRYDVVTPGNHEYNYPLDQLDRMQRGRRYAIVSANIVRTPRRVSRYPADTMITRGGVKIGITGATTPSPLVADAAHLDGKLTFLRIADAVPPVIRRLRARGADVTLLVAHSGLAGPSNYPDSVAPPEHDVAAAIAASGDIDVAVIGHTHREIADTTVGATLVVQPKYWAQSVAVVRLAMVRQGGRWRIASKHGTVVPLANERPDSALAAALAPWHRLAMERMSLTVGRSADAMPATRTRLEDTPLIDFVSGVMRERAGADLAAASSYDTIGGIAAGDVSLRNLMALYPYENTLRAVRISGVQLRAYLEHATRYYRGMGPDGPIVNASVYGYNFDQLSGADYEIDLGRPVGQRITQLLVHGRDVRDTDTFTLALNDYRQQGGGGFAMLAAAPVVYDRGELIRDLLADEVRRRGTIHAADYFVRNWRIRGASDSIRLRVFATNDFHAAMGSRVAPWSNRRPVGGAAALAGMMTRLTTECACVTIRLDGGDVMQGEPASNLVHGRSMVDVYNAMGYAAVAIGNHEFDWGIDTLVARIHQARFAWLAANISENRTRTAPSWAMPWTIVTAGSLKVAVVGYTTPGTVTSTKPENVVQLGFRGAPALDSAIAQARARRPDYVIVVAHEGAFCNADTGCRGEIVDLANALGNKPDLIVSGHTHSLVSTVVNGIPIVQARSSGTALGIVDFPAGGGAPNVRVETVFADREPADSVVARLVESAQASVRPLTERRIAELAQDLPRDGDQFQLADMVADAMRQTAHADIALINNTGVRAALRAGVVTWGDLYAVLPFGNYVVRMSLPGSVLRQVLEHGLAVAGDARASVSGATVRVDRSAPQGRRVIATLSDGRVIADDQTYTFATWDFLAQGGSGYSMLRGRAFENTGVDELDAFIALLRRMPQPVRAAQPHVPRITQGN